MLKRRIILLFALAIAPGVSHAVPYSGYARTGGKDTAARDKPFYVQVRNQRVTGLLFALAAHERFTISGRLAADGSLRLRLLGDDGSPRGSLTGRAAAQRLTLSGRAKLSKKTVTLRFRSKPRPTHRKPSDLAGRYFLMGDGPLNEASYVTLKRLPDPDRYKFSIDLNSTHASLDFEAHGITPSAGEQGGITAAKSEGIPSDYYYYWYYLDPDSYPYYGPYYYIPYSSELYYYYYYYLTYATDVRVEFEIEIQTPDGPVTEHLEGYRLP